MKTPNPDTRAMKCHRYLCTLLAAPTRRCSASSAVSPAALHSPFANACFAATYSPASRCAVAMRQKILATAAAAIGAHSAAAASANPAASRAQPNAAEYAFLRSATAARLLCAAAAFRVRRQASPLVVMICSGPFCSSMESVPGPCTMRRSSAPTVDMVWKKK